MSTEVLSQAPVQASPYSDQPRMADPLPIGFALFAFALGVFAVRFLSVDTGTIKAGSASLGLTYAVLVAGVAQTVVGFFAIARGVTYPAYIMATFGIWLLGFFMLVTQGAANKDFTPNALAWYVLVLLIPVVIMAVPAVVHRNVPFILAFVGLIVLLLTLGLAYHDVYSQVVAATAHKHAPSFGRDVTLLHISGWGGVLAACSIWFVLAKEVYQATGVLKRM